MADLATLGLICVMVLAPPVSVVDLAPPVGVVNLALPVGVVWWFWPPSPVCVADLDPSGSWF